MYGTKLIVTRSLYNIQQRAAIVTHVAWQGTRTGYKKAILELAPGTACLARTRILYDNSSMMCDFTTSFEGSFVNCYVQSTCKPCCVLVPKSR